MTITLELSPEAEKIAINNAATDRLCVTDYLQQLLLQQRMPRTMEELIARATVRPGGSNGLADIIGKRPGEETDEEIARALADLS